MPDDDIDDPNEPPNIRQMRNEIKALKTEAAARQAAEEKADKLEWELAIRDAEIPLDALQRKALLAVHEGERTSEAIRDTAMKLGFAAAPPPSPEVPAQHFAGLGRISDASAGAPTGVTDPDAELTERLRSAKSEAEFDAIYRASGRAMAR